jgi:cytochrome c553
MYAKELADEGIAAWEAAKKKDKQALSDVGDKLVTTCENCHKAYKPEVPTEGILHPH